MSLPFLNPWMLLALPAVAVPVLIHLLNRHRSVTIEWGAMDLLRRVMVFRSRQIRLEDLVLMAVRCAVVLLLVLAVARPTTRALPMVRSPDTGVVIAVDASMSLMHRPGLRSRFDEAIQRTRDILQTVENGRPVTLVSLAGRPRVLFRHAGHDLVAAEEALKEMRPSREPLNLETGLEELSGLLAELKAPRRELFIVTDAQRATFGSLSDKAKRALAELSNTAQVFIAAVPCAGEDNLAVTRLELSSGVLRAGAIARFGATVRNLGRVAQDAGEVSLVLNDQVVDRRFVGRLGPGESASVRLYAPLERAGMARLTARLGEDALVADSARHAVVNVRSALRVLCVDGDPMERSDARPASLVAMALSPGAIEQSEARPSVQTIPWTALPSARLIDYEVVALVNVPDVPDDRALALRKFVEEGGGLIVMAGSNVKPEVLDRRFVWGGASLLPARVIALAGGGADGTSGTPLDLSLPDHPLAEPLLSLPRDLLGECRFHQFLRVAPLPEARPVLKLATGEPIILERQIGKGKVLLWTSGAERTWSNLAINPAFPMLLQQAATHLCRHPCETAVTVPDPIVLPLPTLAAGEDVDVVGPENARSTAQTTPRAGETVVQTLPTPTPGFWEIQARRDGTALTVAANVDASESDVKVLGADEWTEALGEAQVRVLASDQNIAAAVAEARTGRELWQVLLIAAAILLAGEALLSRWYTRRGA